LKAGIFIWIFGSILGIDASCEIDNARRNPSYGSETAERNKSFFAKKKLKIKNFTV